MCVLRNEFEDLSNSKDITYSLGYLQIAFARCMIPRSPRAASRASKENPRSFAVVCWTIEVPDIQNSFTAISEVLIAFECLYFVM